MNAKSFLLMSVLFIVTSCASDDVNRELTIDEKKAELYYDQGTSELIQKNYSQALNNLLKAKELRPLDSKVRTNLGMAYYFKEQVQLAVSELKEAIKLDTKNSDAKLNLATIYFETGKINDARKIYEELTKDLTFSSLFRVYYNLSLIELKIGDKKSAFENLFKSVKEKEDYCQAHFKLGELYTEEMKYGEALKSFQEAGKGVCVNDPTPHFYQALTLVELNRVSEAKAKLNYIVEKFPKTAFKSKAEKKLRNLEFENRSETAKSINQPQTEIINNETTETPKF
jgi:type IV pilus assembly protein PilF